MAAIVNFLRKFRHTVRGATAIEYGFLAALIAIAMISAMALLGDSLNTLFGGLSSEVDQAKATADGVKGNCGDGEGDGSAECK